MIDLTGGQTLTYAGTLTGDGGGTVEFNRDGLAGNASGNAAGTITIGPGFTDPAGRFLGRSDSLAGVVHVNPLTAAGLQAALPQDPLGPNALALQAANTFALASVIRTVDDLDSPALPVTITVTLTSGIYRGQTASPPPNVTLVIQSGGGSVTFLGASPAFTLLSGAVVTSGVGFTNVTDAPTVPVAGGSLTLRDDVIEETRTGGAAAALVTGGTLDLGIADDPGNNTLIVHGPGSLVADHAAAVVSAVGNAFLLDDAVLSSPYRVRDLVEDGLDAGGGGLVDYDPGNVYMTTGSGSIARAVAAAPGYAVHVETAGVAGAPPASPAGTSVDLTALPSTPGVPDPFRYTWAVARDGDPYDPGSGAAYQFLPDDNGTFLVTLTVADADDPAAVSTQKEIEVFPVPPTASLGGVPAGPTVVGEPVALTASATDPSAADVRAGLGFAWTVTRGTAVVALGVGDHAITAGCGGTADYHGSTSATATVTVGRLTPQITWKAPAGMVYGTPPGPAQLDATAGVPGTFTYRQPAETVLPAGPDQVLTVEFTPEDLTQAVSAVTPGAGTPTGSVRFYDGPAAIGAYLSARGPSARTASRR